GNKAFDQREVRLRIPDDVTEPDLLGWPRELQTARAAAKGRQVAAARERIDHLHQVRTGDPIGCGHLLDRYAPVACGVRIHEHAKSIVGELGELHGALRQHGLDSSLTYLITRSNLR